MYYKSKQLAKTLIELDREKPGEEEKIAEDFIKFCQKKNITRQLRNIIKQLELEAKKSAELEKCYIKTDQNVSTAVIELIKKYINIPQNIQAEVTTDPSIRGGFVAKHRGVVYDGSAKRQLEKLKNNLRTN